MVGWLQWACEHQQSCITQQLSSTRLLEDLQPRLGPGLWQQWLVPATPSHEHLLIRSKKSQLNAQSRCLVKLETHRWTSRMGSLGHLCQPIPVIQKAVHGWQAPPVRQVRQKRLTLQR